MIFEMHEIPILWVLFILPLTASMQETVLLSDRGTIASLPKLITSVQLALISCTTKLYLLIPIAIWLIFRVSNIVQTFHIAILIITFVVRWDIGLVISNEVRLSPSGAMILLNEDLSTSRIDFKLFSLIILVSVFFEQVCLLRDGVAVPIPNPPLLSRLGTGNNPKRATCGVCIFPRSV